MLLRVLRMWRTAARVSSANASVSDGIGNRGIFSLLSLASYNTVYVSPSAPHHPPEVVRDGRVPAPYEWRRARLTPTAPTATERHYNRILLPTPPALFSFWVSGSTVSV